MHINAAMLAVMNFVVTHYRIAGRAYLDAGQCVPIDVVVFDEATAFAENIHAALVSVVDFIFAYSWIAVRCYPHTY